jgi:CubicO group peptidase (beta-lactamase class C family)
MTGQIQKRFFCFVLTAVLVAGFSYGENLADDPRMAAMLKILDVWIDAEVDYKDIPSLSVGIVYDQHLIWSKGFGYAHVDKKAAAEPNTIYSICSISKLFTSISIMKLRDEGKLRLDDPIETHLPWFNIKDKFPDAPEVTIRGILTHSSGLPREADYPYWTGPVHNFPTREEIRAKLSGQEELYPAETYFQYSNLGMALLGEVVTAVSGIPFDEYVQENILNPLKMRDTSPEIPERKQGGQLATGYTGKSREGKRQVVPFYRVNGIAPAAGFASTVEDLARFASWQFRLLEKGGTEVLSANTLKEMHRVHWVDPDWKTTWGLGFSITRWEDKTYVGHGGYCPGYRTLVITYPEGKLAIIVMTNTVDVSPRSYAEKIFRLLGPEITKVVKSPGEVKPHPPELEKFVGRYQSSPDRETHVLIKGGELVLFILPNDSPSDAIMRLKHIEGTTFRRIRDDGKLGEPVFFELGPDGKVERLVRNSQYATRIQ